MAKTLEQLRSQLGAIEPNESTYAGIGSAEIPLLEILLQDKEAWLASRAVFALSRIPDPKAVSALSRVAADSRQEIRVAVAASAVNLKPSDANPLLLRLLTDSELGVRKFAVRAVSDAHNATVHAKLRALETQDPSGPIRDAAKSKLVELKRIRP
jgi:HEAT repeat protein